MNKGDLEKYGNYEVYRAKPGDRATICVCAHLATARKLATLLAMNDPEGVAYGVTNVDYPDSFVPGGGWYKTYKRGADGRLKTSCVE